MAGVFCCIELKYYMDMLSLSPRKQRIVSDPIRCQRLVYEMCQSQCYSSMILGADAESEFKVQVENLGWLWEKVPDKDEENRYDFDVLSNRDFHRVEVKEGKDGIVSVNFRDGQPVRLPSGRIWRTTARHISQDFDFLAVYTEEEFRLLSFSVLSPLKPQNSKDFIFTKDEKEWMSANYLSGNVNTNKFTEWIKLDDL